MRKIENGLRIGVSIAKAVPQPRSAPTAVGKGLDTLDSAAGSAKKLGNTLEATQRAVKLPVPATLPVPLTLGRAPTPRPRPGPPGYVGRLDKKRY